jgi:molybdopterin-guanine dinucleotide biosynthesis protein B
MTIPHLAFVGFSGSGKTTLVSQVIMQLKHKGYRVGVLKHDAHDFQMDVEGKDTYKYSEAGADLVAISSATKLNILEQLQNPLELEEILQHMNGVDLILIEGYKQANVPKILIARTLDQLALRDEISPLIAIATTLKEETIISEESIRLQISIPILDLNQSEVITAFVEQWFLQAQLHQKKTMPSSSL